MVAFRFTNIQRSEGTECKVSDPLFNYQFDLTPLRKSASNYNVSAEGYHYLLNVCGPLHSPPAECASMGSCQTGATLSSPVAAGMCCCALCFAYCLEFCLFFIPPPPPT